MCAPLTFPTGDSAIDPPTQPNRKPVIMRRNTTLGRRRSIGLPAPNMKMTTERPPSTSSAVPIASERYSCRRCSPDTWYCDMKRVRELRRHLEDVIAPGRQIEVEPMGGEIRVSAIVDRRTHHVIEVYGAT